MNKIDCKTKQCVLFYNSASEEKTRICCQERLHSHCATAGQCAAGSWGTAGSAHLTRAMGTACSSPQGSTGTCCSSMAATRWELGRHSSALLYTCWAGLGQWWAPYSSLPSTHQGVRDATEVSISLPRVSALINLSVTLAHRVKIERTSRLLWCTQDPVGCSPPLWEDGSNVHTAGTPQSQCFSNLCHATLLFQHTLGSRKPAGFPERSVNWKAHYFEHSFWRCLLKTQLPNERNVRVARTALRTLESAAISGNRHSSCTSGQEHMRSCETVNLLSVQRETPNNHIKKPHLLIPGGPSKCLSGFLKVLGSEGPTWVSSALSLPVCDWRNEWAEPLCHWIMDLSSYSCIRGVTCGSVLQRCVLTAAPHNNTTGAPGSCIESNYTLIISHFLIFTSSMYLSTSKEKRGLCISVC